MALVPASTDPKRESELKRQKPGGGEKAAPDKPKDPHNQDK